MATGLVLGVAILTLYLAARREARPLSSVPAETHSPMELITTQHPGEPTAPFAEGPARAPQADSPRERVESPSPTEDEGRAPHAPRTEKEHVEAFLELLRRDPGEFEGVAFEILEEEGPDAAKVALLRAAYEGEAAITPDLFDTAFRSLSADAPAGRVSVPAFAVRYLGDRVTRDPLAWDILEDAVWPGGGTTSVLTPRLRRRAAARLAATAKEEDLYRIGDELTRETDRALLDSVAAALASNPCREAVERVARRLDLKVAEPPAETTEDGKGNR